ncbi:MAG TPA: hypothetical protein VI365_04735 [Trebonia sp.]
MAQDPGHSGHNHLHGPGHSGPGHSAHDGGDQEQEWADGAELDGDADWDDDEWDEDYDEADELSLKEAFGLPDELPPIRLPADAELAVAARAVPMLSELAALASWVGERGRAVDADAQLSSADKADALSVLDVPAERFGYLWKYAGAVDWIEETEDGRVTIGETAQEWADGDDGAVSAWSATFAAVLTEAMCAAATGAPDRPAGIDFHVPGASVALLFFMARREGLTLAEISEVVEESATADLAPRAAKAWGAYVKAHGNPATVLVDQLTELGAITAPDPADEAVRLTPLGLREMRLQFTDAGVDVPLLPDNPAEMTAAELVAMADGVTDDEFEAESAAWLQARDPQDAAAELLGVGAAGDPADRLLVVALVNELGSAAESAWRDRLDMLEVRPYAKAALARLAGLTDADQLPADIEPDTDDLAWMATDLLAIACDDEDTDADELAEVLAETLPPDGNVPAFLDLISRSPHPDALDVLEHIGEYHPDKSIEKEARRVLYKASMREAARERAGH